MGPQFSESERAQADRALAPDPPDLSGAVFAGNETVRADVDLNVLDRSMLRKRPDPNPLSD
jgi:hypothetical protein